MSNNNVKNVKKVDDILEDAKNAEKEFNEKLKELRQIIHDVSVKKIDLKGLPEKIIVHHDGYNYKQSKIGEKTTAVLKLADDIKKNLDNEHLEKLIGHVKDGVERINRIKNNLPLKFVQSRNIQVNAAKDGLDHVKTSLSRLNSLLDDTNKEINRFNDDSLDLIKLVAAFMSEEFYIRSDININPDSIVSSFSKVSDDLRKVYYEMYKKYKKERGLQRSASQTAERELLIKELMKKYPGKTRDQIKDMIDTAARNRYNAQRRGTRLDADDNFFNKQVSALATWPGRSDGGGALPKRKRQTRRRNK